jgi:hypothetical protein
MTKSFRVAGEEPNLFGHVANTNSGEGKHSRPVQISAYQSTARCHPKRLERLPPHFARTIIQLKKDV